MSQVKTYSFSTGWFGRASEQGHSAKSTKVHLLVNGKPVCGYKPHKTMQFQWCASSIMNSYIECSECKEKATEYEYKDKQWVKKTKRIYIGVERDEKYFNAVKQRIDRVEDKELILECLRFTELHATEPKKTSIRKLWLKLTEQ